MQACKRKKIDTRSTRHAKVPRLTSLRMLIHEKALNLHSAGAAGEDAGHCLPKCGVHRVKQGGVCGQLLADVLSRSPKDAL